MIGWSFADLYQSGHSRAGPLLQSVVLPLDLNRFLPVGAGLPAKAQIFHRSMLIAPIRGQARSYS